MLSAKPAEAAPPMPSEPAPRAPHPTAFPFYHVPGLSNFREIGGWPIVRSSSSASPKRVRRGIIYRGSDTNRITLDGEAKLRDLGIGKDFDLRSKQQIERTGGFRKIDGVERVWAPVFGEEEYTEEEARKRYELYAGEGTDGIVMAFVEILQAGAPMFHTVLTTLLSSSKAGHSRGLFMHCTTGNNRTGVFISLLLLLLGVPTGSIVAEYALSEQGLAPTRHINVERLLKKGAFSEYGAEKARRKCERMVGAREESMEALLEEVKRKWDGAEGYFIKVVGLTREEIEELKDVLTEGGDNTMERGGD